MSILSKYFIPGICVLPMILHWLLPSGIEDTLCYFNILGVKFFIPDTLYFLYIFYYNFVKSNKNKQTLPHNIKILIGCSCLLIIIYCFLYLIFSSITYPMTLLINNLSFVWLALLFMFAPLSHRQIQLTKPFMVVTLLILVGEVFLFSVGLMQYQAATGGQLSGQDFDGIMRISTTIGGSTGSAVVIGLLGAFCLTVYEWDKVKQLILIIIVSMGVFFTMSRGSSLVWILFIAYFIRKHYLKHVPFGKRIKVIVTIFIMLIGLYFAGLFKPIEARVLHMEESTDFSAGRDDKMHESLQMINESGIFGYGLGQVFPEKAVALDYTTPLHYAPHNAYALLAIELGLPGLVLFLSLFAGLLLGMNYKKDLSIYIILVFLINANTESIVLDSEYAALIVFSIMTVSKYKNKYRKIQRFPLALAG